VKLGIAILIALRAPFPSFSRLVEDARRRALHHRSSKAVKVPKPTELKTQGCVDHFAWFILLKICPFLLRPSEWNDQLLQRSSNSKAHHPQHLQYITPSLASSILAQAPRAARYAIFHDRRSPLSTHELTKSVCFTTFTANCRSHI
jgi:hypothetical protein